MKLRPYQIEVAKTVAESVMNNLGMTITVEIARQGGKNELSAHLEVLLMTMFIMSGGNIVKCSPTFKPQTIISMSRLKERLDQFGFAGIWITEAGYMVRLGDARCIFLSAEETASVVGHTADILLEIDEAQDVAEDKFTKDFRPMASPTNTTTVLYGTTWDDMSLLEKVKQLNLEREKKDSIKRHFRYDWQEIAKYNKAYRSFVESERERLGETHPLFLTQYALLPIRGGGGFLSPQQIAMVKGNHPRQLTPQPPATYIAGIDLAGQEEQDDETILVKPGRDATVLTIAKLVPAPPHPDPYVEVVQHYSWVGTKHPELYGQMVAILKDNWHCQRVVCDATGIGEPTTAFLAKAIGGRVTPYKFTQKTKSDAGFDLLAAINAGRLKVYEQDGSEEYKELMFQLQRAKSTYRPNQTINFFVDPSEGHDDYLTSLALVVQAAKFWSPRKAVGGERKE